jgi:hypothetical protein
MVCFPNSRKGGWVVYRTTYTDDEKWKRCNEILQKELRTESSRYDHDTYLSHLEFPVLEDSERFDEATTATLRQHFLEWRAEREPEYQRDITAREERNPRSGLVMVWPMQYLYFIRVDEGYMNTILELDTNPEGATPWIDVVEADWPPGPNYHGGNEDEPLFEREGIFADDGHPEIEGMTPCNIGFERIYAGGPYPHYWWNNDENDRFWQRYKRPALDPSQQVLARLQER